MELAHYFFPSSILRALAGSYQYSQHYGGQQLKENKRRKKEAPVEDTDHVKRSHVDTTVKFGNTEIPTPLLLGKCYPGWPNSWLMGVMTKLSLFVVAEGW